LLPASAPDIPGLDIAGVRRPARIIGGDLYDFFELPGERALIAFGDVSGKGVAAALYGALISGLLRTLAPRRREPAPLLKALNDALFQRKVEARFVCLLLLGWDPASRELLIANSGVPAPLICRGGALIQPQASGVPPGLLPGTEYEQIAFQTAPGDLVVLYSDGISDQTNPAGEEYDRARLQRLLGAGCPDSPQAVLDVILADLDRFSQTAPVFDDQTLVVLRVKE
jgi:sigma-B regulation protein RsbU (phosphoserine phosphatase)